eukprot:2531920-Alexandrium_andersonii.AAC.1
MDPDAHVDAYADVDTDAHAHTLLAGLTLHGYSVKAAEIGGSRTWCFGACTRKRMQQRPSA